MPCSSFLTSRECETRVSGERLSLLRYSGRLDCLDRCFDQPLPRFPRIRTHSSRVSCGLRSAKPNRASYNLSRNVSSSRGV